VNLDRDGHHIIRGGLWKRWNGEQGSSEGRYKDDFIERHQRQIAARLQSPPIEVNVEYNNSNSNASKGDACLWQRTRIKRIFKCLVCAKISPTPYIPHKTVTESGPPRPRPPDLSSARYMMRLIKHRTLDPGSVESSDPCHSQHPRTWEGASLHSQAADEQP
jgi:hypothetical protein